MNGAAQDANEWCRTVKEGGEVFIKTWITAKTARDSLRYYVGGMSERDDEGPNRGSPKVRILVLS